MQVIQETEQDELEQEDEMEAISGRRSWGEQIPAPRRRTSFQHIQEGAAVEDELEADDQDHQVMTVEGRRLSVNQQSREEEQVADQQRPSQGKSTGEGKEAEFVKTPAKALRRTSTGEDVINEKPGTAESEQENERETHSTFIKRMYKPRQPLTDVDEQHRRTSKASTHQSRRRGGKAPVAHMYDSPTTTLPASTVEPGSEAAVDPLDSFDNSYDVSATNNNASTQHEQTRTETEYHGPSITLDPRTLSATRLNLARGTPFIEVHEKQGTFQDVDEDGSPIRGRKRQRRDSPPPDPTTSQGEFSRVTHAPRQVVAMQTRTSGPSAVVESSMNESQDVQQTDHSSRRKPPAKTVPITVYRFSNPVNLGDGDGDDPLNDGQSSVLSMRGLPGVNAVDTLAQIVSEIVEHMSDHPHRLPTVSFSTAGGRGRTNAHDQPSQSSADLKRKRAVLHHFQQSLAEMLFDITAAVDAGAVLKSRLRALTKEKVDLREELFAVKSQREEVALGIDRVRREHGIWKDKVVGRNEISADLWDLEMAVKRGREECQRRREAGEEVEGVKMGVDMLARVVAGQVSGCGDAGLCGKVERFNGVLERAADVLEGRSK